MEIVPGVHLIEGVRGSNVYLLVDDGELLLVDTGMPGNTDSILRYIKELGREPHGQYVQATWCHWGQDYCSCG